MDNNLGNYTDGFMLQYDAFVQSCDAAEAEGLWNTEEYGEMEGYYFNILMGVILHLIVVDGNIAESEVDYLNSSFGFEYTTDSLLEVYYSVGSDIEQNYLENAKNGLELLKGMNEEIAQKFRELLSLVCRIITESDADVREEELAELRDLEQQL